MSTEGFLEFCGSPFWNSSLTWSSKPGAWLEFTECFQNTILVWVPSAWLLFTLPIYLYNLQQNARQKRPLTTLNIVKSVISVLLAFLSFLVIANKLPSNGIKAPPVFYLSNSLKIFCYSLTSVIVQVERFKGAITSPILFIYWLFTVIAEIIPFYSLILQHQEISNLVNFVIFFMSYAFLLIQLILSAFVEKSIETEDLCLEDKASFPSFLLYNWIHHVLKQSFKGKLTDSDIPSLPVKIQSEYLITSFEKHWNQEVSRNEKARKKKTNEELLAPNEQEISSFNESTPLLDKPTFNKNYTEEKSSLLDEDNKDLYASSLIRTLFYNFGGSFALAYTLKLISDVVYYLNPLLLHYLIAFTDSDDPMWKGFTLAIGLLLTNVVAIIFLTQFERINQTTCMKMKYALIGAIYKKSFRLSSEAKRRITTGEIVNLMSVDCERINEKLEFLWILLSSPVEISIALYLLYNILGVAAFSGLALIVCFIPFNLIVTKYTGYFATAQMNVKDRRLNVFGEVINGIKVLKLYAWEASFEEKIKNIRQMEMNLLRKSSFFLAGLWFIWTVSPFLVMLVSFATYVLTTGKILDAQTAFVAQSIFNMMRIPMNLLPEMFINLAEAYVSLKRLKTYFNAEVNPFYVLHESVEGKPVIIENGSFSWDKSGEPILQGINISIREGSLVAVVGQVGSGKSSLLSSILGDMNKLSGKVNVRGSIAYVPQEAWIQNATIKDNILFGSPYVKKKYEKVLEACQLLHDLSILPGGDMTEIGEKGINLSGGQKQRISLARAVYADADIYLMDSPLSAVDANVGKELFDNVLSSEGLLKRKTRIWITNAIQWLPYVETVIVMSGGYITDVDPYEKLINKGGQFSEFLNTYMFRQTDSNDQQGIVRASPDKFGRQISVLSDVSESSLLSPSYRNSKNPETLGHNLTEEEYKQEGSVKMKVYFSYVKAMGLTLIVLMILSQILFQVSDIGASLWLTHWTNDPFLTNTSNSNTSEFTDRTDNYLIGYSLFGLGQALCILLFTFIGAFAYVRASYRLHNNMLYSILRTPLSFFDTTPMGRITNRFSQDIDTIDNAIQNQMNTVFQTVVNILASIIIICISIPIFSALVIPLFACYFLLLYFYIPTAREMERTNSVTRSPIFSHFSETLSGTASIKAYGATERFIQQSQKRVNDNIKPFYCLLLANEWCFLRMLLLSSGLVFCTCVAGILSRKTLNGALLGMAINYAFEVTQILNWLLSVIVQIQTSFISVERVNEYCNLQPEAPWHIDSNDLDPDWPQTGSLEFKEYRTRYRPGLDLVLKGINCYVNSGEKIGVVGRTGAGKSSLTLALFRIIESVGGSILIDGQSIANMGLHDLRSKLTIFPQDPVLFSGTLRSNLDPFQAYSDPEIWRAIQHAHLDDYVQRQATGLQYECGENGQNLSMGQKQLVCLARALLHKTKLLVLDEATAAVDLETDALIQQTIREEFSDCTVLTIAHRLNTILDYDRIMVLDQGSIVEFDSPHNLLNDPLSRFSHMARDAGCT